MKSCREGVADPNQLGRGVAGTGHGRCREESRGRTGLAVFSSLAVCSVWPVRKSVAPFLPCPSLNLLPLSQLAAGNKQTLRDEPGNWQTLEGITRVVGQSVNHSVTHFIGITALEPLEPKSDHQWRPDSIASRKHILCDSQPRSSQLVAAQHTQ